MFRYVIRQAQAQQYLCPDQVSWTACADAALRFPSRADATRMCEAMAEYNDLRLWRFTPTFVVYKLSYLSSEWAGIADVAADVVKECSKVMT